MTAAGQSGSPRAPATAILGAVFILAGLGFGLTAALVCGVALLAVAGGAVGWVELATVGGRLEREPGPRRLEETQQYPLRIRLRRTVLPPPGGELIDPLLEKRVTVGPRWRRRISRQVSLNTPGRRRLAPTRLVVRDPLGLWQRELDSGGSEELIVLPRIDPIRWADPGAEPRARSAGRRRAATATSGWAGLAEFEVDGLRPYRDGSPASRIHWPAVARTGEMIERRLVAGGRQRPLVVFDPRGAADPDARARAMRATASLCIAFARWGGCELLLPGERRAITIDPALRAWPEAHARLAVSDPRARPAVGSETADATILWVTAGRTVPTNLRRLGPGSFLVTPRRSGRSAAFRVSGCLGYPAAGAVQAPGRRAAA